MTSTLTDRAAACFRRHLAGDRDGFDDLVRQVTPLLWHVARSQGLDRTLAEDVVQRGWLALVRRAEAIEEPRAVVSWLVTTVRRDAWRAHSRDQPVRGDDLPATVGQVDPADTDWVATAQPDLGPALQAELGEQAVTLWAHVKSLSPRCQALLRVIAFADKPDYASLSQALDMPVGSIGPTRGRCLAKLRQLLDNDDTFEFETQGGTP